MFWFLLIYKKSYDKDYDLSECTFIWSKKQMVVTTVTYTYTYTNTVIWCQLYFIWPTVFLTMQIDVLEVDGVYYGRCLILILCEEFFFG